jgi:hypothetical protein
VVRGSERRNWVNRVSELRTGGKFSIEYSFLLFLFFSTLLSSIIYDLFRSRPSIYGVGAGSRTPASQSIGG